MSLFTIDPGKDKAAIAHFVGGALCVVRSGPVWVACDWLVDHYNAQYDRCIIECPQVYQQRSLRGDPNDLIMVAVTVGRLQQVVKGDARLVRPHTWKGSMPKANMHARIKSLLTADEQHVLTAAKIATAHRGDVLDAIGIGLWELGRLTK